MHFGVDLGRCNPHLWLSSARAGDELGYESVWLPEHLIFPETIAGSPDGTSPSTRTRPCSTRSQCWPRSAAVTETIRLGTNVYNIGLRHPFVDRAAPRPSTSERRRFHPRRRGELARAEWEPSASTSQPEARASTRARDLPAVVERTHRRAHGEYYDFGPVVFEPKPVQAHLPIHVGGDSDRALRRTAELGDGWITMLQDEAPFAAAVERLRGQM